MALMHIETDTVAASVAFACGDFLTCTNCLEDYCCHLEFRSLYLAANLQLARQYKEHITTAKFSFSPHCLDFETDSLLLRLCLQETSFTLRILEVCVFVTPSVRVIGSVVSVHHLAQ